MEQKKLFTPVEKVLLFLFVASFLSLFAVLAIHNRPAADDFIYLANISEKGIWGCMTDLYFGYSGRWMAYLFAGFVLSFHNNNLYLFSFSSITIILLIAVLDSLIRKITKTYSRLILSQHISVLYAIILTTALFFSSYSIGETWFWTVQVCTYLWSILMSLLLLNVLLEKNIKPHHVPLIIISTIFIGGASESFALVNIFLLVVYLTFSNGRFILYPKRNNKIIAALIFLTASFTVTMLAPGNEVRLGFLPKVSFTETIWIQFKSFIKIDFIKTPILLPNILLFSFPWLILGRFFSGSMPKEKLKSIFPAVKKYFVLLIVLIFIFLIPTSFIMSELGPDRALSQISFFTTFSFSALFYYLGYKVEVSEKIFQTLKFITLIFSIAVLFYHLSMQFPLTKKYAAAYDQRIELLKKMNQTEQTETIELKPLPVSGMLYSAEISRDTIDFRNQFLKKYLGIEKEIKVN
ncbi:MAG: hypothetical protein JJE25_05345 [Bacteroidia bacterium]|nr:hypothetical protein [Bacteroidia bacterium]